MAAVSPKAEPPILITEPPYIAESHQPRCVYLNRYHLRQEMQGLLERNSAVWLENNGFTQNPAARPRSLRRNGASQTSGPTQSGRKSEFPNKPSASRPIMFKFYERLMGSWAANSVSAWRVSPQTPIMAESSRSDAWESPIGTGRKSREKAKRQNGMADDRSHGSLTGPRHLQARGSRLPMMRPAGAVYDERHTQSYESMRKSWSSD